MTQKIMAPMPDIQSENIVFFGQRVEPYFASSLVAGGLADVEMLRQYFDLDDPVSWFVHSADHAKHNYDFFNVKSELDTFLAVVRSKMEHEDTTYLDTILSGCLRAGEELVAQAQRLHDMYNDTLTQSQVAEVIAQFAVAARAFCIFYTIAFFDRPALGVIEDMIARHIESEEDKKALFGALTTASMQTDTDLEQEAFLKLVTRLYLSHEEKQEAAHMHAQTYGWLGIRFFLGQEWTTEDVLARMSAQSPEAVRTAQLAREEEHAHTETLLTTFKASLSPKEQSSVDQVRSMVYLRTQRADFFHHASALVLPFIRDAARLLTLSFHDLMYFSPEEGVAALRGTYELTHDLQERRKEFLVYYGAHSAVLSGAEAHTYVSERAIFYRSEEHVEEVRGVPAYKGVVRGRARIVITSDDGLRVERGDILVSTMTTPNFIAAMERATAFVTDEGGILCHAAIVAREMKKPCIIATKIATQVLRDGDLVEVDADNGVVRVISRA
jgi:phosphohistidine swiveling domain-containing protein